MSVTIHCPNGHKLEVLESYAGKRTLCPRCHSPVQIPHDLPKPEPATPTPDPSGGADTFALHKDVPPADGAADKPREPMAAQAKLDADADAEKAARDAKKQKNKKKKKKGAGGGLPKFNFNFSQFNFKEFIATDEGKTIVAGICIAFAAAFMGYNFFFSGPSGPPDSLDRSQPAEEKTSTLKKKRTTAVAAVADGEEKPAGFQLSYAPPGSEFIAVLRLGDAFKSDLGKSIQNAGPIAKQILTTIESQFGAPPSAIDSVIIASPSLPQALARTKAAAALPLGALADALAEGVDVADRSAVPMLIINSSERLDIYKVTAKAKRRQPVQYYDWNYHLLKYEDGTERAAYFTHDDKMMIFGAEKQVVTAMGGIKKGAQLPTAIAALANDAQFTIAVMPKPETFKAIKAKAAELAKANAGDPLANARLDVADLFAKDGSAFAVGLKLSDQLETRTTLFVKSPVSLKPLQAAMDQYVAARKKAYEAEQESLPVPLRPIIGGLIAGLQAKQAGAGIEVAATANTDLFNGETIAKMPGALVTLTFGSNGFAELMASLSTSRFVPPEPSAEVKQGDVTETLYFPSTSPDQLIAPDAFDYQTVTLRLSGPTAAKAIGYGRLRVDTAIDGNGFPLKVVHPTLSTLDSSQRFVRLDPKTMFVGRAERPDDAIEIHLFLSPPSAGAQELIELTGALKLLTTKEQRELTISNLNRQFGQRLSDPALTQAGLTITLGPEPQQTAAGEARRVLTLAVNGNHQNLVDFQLVDKQGTPITEGVTSSIFGETMVVHLAVPKSLKDAQLKLKLAGDVEEVEVPFLFQDVPLHPQPPTAG